MKKITKRYIIVIIFLLVFITATSLTFGKYVYNSAWNYYLSSKGFYFESDYLDINTKKNSILKWDGSSVYFDIKNSQNEKLISEYDISYKVTCEVLGDEANYIKCNLNNFGSSSFSGKLASTSKCINKIDNKDVSSYSKADCELNGYLWNEEIANKSNYFDLELTDATKSIDEVSVKITAESITPYHETLSGIFNLNYVGKIDLQILTDYSNYDDYIEYSIANVSESKKCVKVVFDANDYSLDTDVNKLLNYETDSNDKINQFEVQIQKENNEIYTFYKINDNKVYSTDDISIQEKEC